MPAGLRRDRVGDRPLETPQVHLQVLEPQVPEPPVEWSAIADAASDGDYLTVQRHLQTQIHPTDCATALVYACASGHFDIALLLLTANANPNPILEPGYFTPLMYAAYAGRWDLLYALLQAGADPHATTADGYTPLHFAELGAIEGHEPQGQFAEVIQTLQQFDFGF